MYKDVSSENSFELFKKYSESENYKERAEAGKILAYLDKESIKQILPKIISLNNDSNIAVRLNLLSSLKAVFSKYPSTVQDILIFVYINAQFSNNIVKEFSEQIIQSVDPKIIDNIVVTNTSKLYSKNNFDVARSLISLAFISMLSPEYLKNSLPELSMISLYAKSDLLRIIAQGILEEFENIDKNLLKELKFIIEYFPEDKNNFNISNAKDDEELFKSIVILNLKNTLTYEDAVFLLNSLKNPHEHVACISAITLKREIKLLKSILEKEPETSKSFSSLILKNIDELNEVTAFHSIILSAYCKILAMFKISAPEALRVIKNKIVDYLHVGNYIINSYALESLNSFSLMGDTELNSQIEEVLLSKNVKLVMGQNILNYYVGSQLLSNLNQFEEFGVENSPYFNEEFVNEIIELPEDLKYEQFKIVEKKINSDDWLERYENAKVFGNLIYAVSKDFRSNFEILNTILKDSTYLVRSVGSWILSIMIERGKKIPKNVILESISYFDDPNVEVRLGYSIFYNKFVKKFPELLKDEEIRLKLQTSLTTKYFTDKFMLIRKICKDTLKKFPDSDYLMDYEHKSTEERYEVLEKAMAQKEMVKTAIIRLKVKLRHSIENKNSAAILEILEFLDKYEKTDEYFNIFSELVEIRDEYPLAQQIISSLKEKFNKIPKYREEIIYTNLNEIIISRRIESLNEILGYALEGFSLDPKIIKKIKEFVIYPQAENKITEKAIKILEIVKSPGTGRVVREKKELDEYIKNRKESPSKSVNVKTQTWKEIYSSLNYLITQDYETSEHIKVEFSDFLRFNALSSEKNSVIITIILLDIMTKNLKAGDPELLKEIEKNSSNVLKCLSELILSEKEYPLLAYKTMNIFKVVLDKKSSWFMTAVLQNTNFEEYVPLLSRLLDEKSSLVQVHVLEILRELIKLNIKCTEYPEIHEKVLNLISDDEKWIVFKKALEVVYNCKFENQPDLLNEVGNKIVNYLETAHDDSKLFLIKFFKIKGIEKINDELFKKLMKFRNSSNPYVSSELNELYEKRKMFSKTL